MTTRKQKLKKNKITFVSNIDGIYEHKELHPQPTKLITPEWFKNMPHDAVKNKKIKLLNEMKTIRMCPSFVDIFKEGYVLVAPCDYWFKVDKDGNWEWSTPDNQLKVEIHEDEQFKNYLPNNKVKKVFKLLSPFSAITPKGWSVRQIPMIYEFNDDWQVAYGVLNTDVEHELNQQILFTSTSEEILIKKGTPLNYIVPFKRSNKLSHIVVEPNDEIKRIINKSRRLVRSSFKSSLPYYRNS
jgi:hypothetical protein